MKLVAKAACFWILIISALSCSLVGRFAGKRLEKSMNSKRADSLWTDVPKMDGLNDSPTEDMPVSVNIILHTFVNLILNSDKTEKPVSTDWIFYKYNGKSSDIKDFYTTEKMKSVGNWSLPEGMTTPCIDGAEKGIYGDVCLYQKLENGKQQGLIVLALPTKEPDVPVFVYFLRVETVPNDSKHSTGQ